MCKRTVEYLSWVSLKEAESGLDFALFAEVFVHVHLLCCVLWGPMCADREHCGQKAADPMAAKEEQG